MFICPFLPIGFWGTWCFDQEPFRGQNRIQDPLEKAVVKLQKAYVGCLPRLAVRVWTLLKCPTSVVCLICVSQWLRFLGLDSSSYRIFPQKKAKEFCEAGFSRQTEGWILCPTSGPASAFFRFGNGNPTVQEFSPVRFACEGISFLLLALLDEAFLEIFLVIFLALSLFGNMVYFFGAS